MGVLGGTFCVPAAGVTDCNANDDAGPPAPPVPEPLPPDPADPVGEPECVGDDPAECERDRHGRDDNRRAHKQHPGTQAQRPACPGFENVHGLRSLKTSPTSQTQLAPTSVRAGSLTNASGATEL